MINSGNNIKSWINYVVRSNKLNLTDNCKAKLLEEELTSQQKHKSHEDNLWELEEERLRKQQQRELERQREEVKREQAQLIEQHKLLKHQMEMTKQQHERELLKKSQELQHKTVG